MMRILTAAVAGLATIGLALGSGATALQHEHHQQGGAVGSKVTLVACVQRAQEEDTFILTQIAGVPDHPRAVGRVVYWLDGVEELRKHVGHHVRIAGTITKVEQSEIEVKAGGNIVTVATWCPVK